MRRNRRATEPQPRYGAFVPRITLVLCCLACLALLLVSSGLARADDPPFHRTTPRGSFAEANGVLVIGVPGGRAWGIESELRPLPPHGTTLIVRIAVHDAAVKEAFLRVAYYATPSGRSRQLATADSPPVVAGARASVALSIEPPAGAVAFRVRLLARLLVPTGRSAADAVTAVLRFAGGSARPAGSLSSRLLE